MQSCVAIAVGTEYVKYAKSKHIKITNKKCVTSGIGTEIQMEMTMTIEDRLERIENILRCILRDLNDIPVTESMPEKETTLRRIK
jgi:DNA-directed RNA polymerase beta' subunit